MSEDTNDGDVINFFKLKSMSLIILPQLKSFYKEKEDLHASSTSIMDSSTITKLQTHQPFFNGTVRAYKSFKFFCLYIMHGLKRLTSV